MNKQAAIERLNALEAEAKALRKVIEEPESAPSFLSKPVPGSKDEYFRIGTESTGRFSVIESVAHNHEAAYYTHGSTFQSEELATDYAEAIDTMLLLRHQPGTVSPIPGRQAYGISWWKRAANIVIAPLESGTVLISPHFSSREYAEAALQTIGPDKIIRMYKTFGNIEE